MSTNEMKKNENNLIESTKLTENQNPTSQLDDLSFRIITTHTFLKEAKNLLKDHMENKTELDIEKLYFLIDRSKSLLDEPHFQRWNDYLNSTK